MFKRGLNRGPKSVGILVLLVLACVAVVGTLFQTYRFDDRLAAGRVLEDTVNEQLHATQLALAEVRQAQSAYVAAGQASASWILQFDEALARVEATLRDRQQTTKSTGAMSHYDAAIEQLAALRTSDARARNYVGSGQPILASDVIFVESREILGRISSNVSAARETEVFTARQSMATVTRYRQGLTAGGLLVVLLVGLLAYRKIGPVSGKTPSDEPVPLPAITPLPDPVPLPRPAPLRQPRPAGASPLLSDAADVCVDLARLLDGRDLPALLTRSAAAIGAKGLVLWVLDESGQSLRASIGHGYSDRMLKRLGQLSVSADNVTSLACRTLQPQLVPGTAAGVSGALAVPLISAGGCVGVLSAEVSDAASDGHQMPVARLIAAQLSAVIRPDAGSAASIAAQ